MANSGIPWIDAIFNWCVHALLWLGERVGLSYEETNVYLFVIAWPLITLVLMAEVWRQRRELRRLRASVNEISSLVIRDK